MGCDFALKRREIRTGNIATFRQFFDKIWSKIAYGTGHARLKNFEKFLNLVFDKLILTIYDSLKIRFQN